ncbi:hypothetical protein FRC07_005254 [Ceratobasidium sp. 392]|nr:hypothetical protein FRC07_005254 [Ceratobasidium sp. 392]
MDTDTLSSVPQLSAYQFNQRVRDAIVDYRKAHPAAFASTSELSYREHPVLLSIFLKECLGLCNMDDPACENYLCKRSELFIVLQSAYGDGSYVDLLSHPAQMPPAVAEFVGKHIVGIRVSGSQDSLKSAFEREYIGEAHTLLIETLNEERKLRTGAPSGMGKSRIVEEAGNLVFTIPINLHEDLSPSTVAKKRFPGRTGADSALAWTDYLKEGQSGMAVGMSKENYLHAVVAETTRNRAGPDKGRTRRELNKSLQDSCRKFISVINPNQPNDVNACFVYFDEAHASTRADEVNVPAVGGTSSGGSFTQVTGVLHQTRRLPSIPTSLVDMPMFFSFSSTNFNFKEFAPTLANFPSAHRLDGTQLIPPFTELPFDVFENELTSLTLDTLRTTQAIVRFGRPLWHA